MHTKAARVEHDWLGEIEISEDCLYGIHTARALGNFRVSGRTLKDEPELLKALVQIKRAASSVNCELDVISPRIAEAISQAALEVLEGAHHQYFVVDLMEGAGGTSLNMNVNEVLANRALQIVGERPGNYSCIHPNDHVNRSQSTNDVIPSALLIAIHENLGQAILSFRKLHIAFLGKADQFAATLRLGRTCLQDAQPMTLGQCFGSYAALTARLVRKLEQCRDDCRGLPLGATAIGTGLGAPLSFGRHVIETLNSQNSAQWRQSDNLFDGLSNADGYARVSGEIRTAAVAIGKVASDLLLLSSGPSGGLREISLPAVQSGSSIMPGKVNPVLPLSVCQVGFAVSGYDVVVASACQQGQLEINAFAPVIAAHILPSIRMLSAASERLAENCIEGIEANEPRMLDALVRSSALATVLADRLGYDRVSELVRKADREGVTLLELLESEGVLGRSEAMVLLRQAAHVGVESQHLER